MSDTAQRVLMRGLIGVLCVLVGVGCSAPAPPVPVATATMPAPAPSTRLDYKAIRQPLLIPLGALIVAVRAKTPTTTYWLEQFNKAADQALPQIEGDTSPNAARLRTSIEQVRAMPNDLDSLENSRSALLEIS